MSVKKLPLSKVFFMKTTPSQINKGDLKSYILFGYRGHPYGGEKKEIS